jgi:hypothetical protein
VLYIYYFTIALYIERKRRRSQPLPIYGRRCIYHYHHHHHPLFYIALKLHKYTETIFTFTLFRYIFFIMMMMMLVPIFSNFLFTCPLLIRIMCHTNTTMPSQVSLLYLVTQQSVFSTHISSPIIFPKTHFHEQPTNFFEREEDASYLHQKPSSYYQYQASEHQQEESSMENFIRF